ncbi:MAG: hypothetical protein ACR2JM_02800 [Mycobacterium sp.]
MTTTILAHGGQITADEAALIGGGLFVAFALPIGALVIAMRRSKRKDEPSQPEDVGQSV